LRRRGAAAIIGCAVLAAASACHHRAEPVAPNPNNPPLVFTAPRDTQAQAPPPARAPNQQPSPVSGLRSPSVISQREGEPTIRVGLVVDRDSAVLGASGQFRFVDSAGATLLAVARGQTVVVRAGDERGTILVSRTGQAPLRLAAPVLMGPDIPGDYISVGGRRYRGYLVVQRGTAGVTVVDRVPMEAYLVSVVALELGFRGPADREAVKAQAVAARSYALRVRGRREALGFDVYPTDADQVYGGVEAELPEVTDAVQSTAGEILTWQGRPIEALFHSTCGWSTEANEQVFQNREPVPYLRAVSDRYGEGDRDFYCAISPRFRWREEWDADGLTAILGRTLPSIVGGSAVIGRVTDIRAGRTTPTGRVYELVVTTTTGTYTVGPGRIRDALRPTLDRQLWSSMFQLYVDREGGRLTKVVAAGAGYGHGVGMCQFGAVGRARAGADYRSILATYYNGTTLERNY
jgi:stage II sporulation protein D